MLRDALLTESTKLLFHVTSCVSTGQWPVSKIILRQIVHVIQCKQI